MLNVVRRLLLLAIAGLQIYGQSFRIEPPRLVQGRAIKVYGDSEAGNARLDHQEIQLFRQVDGRVMGLMPIRVLSRPGIYTLEWIGSNGSIVNRKEVTIRSAHYARQNVVLPKAVAELHSTAEERSKVSTFLNGVSDKRFWTEPFDAPIAGCITSPFGVTRLNNGKLTGDFHAGLDQRGAFGSPIHALTGGRVKIVEQFSLHGGTVAIDHGQGLESMYLHMSRFAVTEGQEVHEGDVIGYVGSTGRSTGPHLHWAIYVYGEPVNPLQWVQLQPCTDETTAQRRPSHRTPRKD